VCFLNILCVFTIICSLVHVNGNWLSFFPYVLFSSVILTVHRSNILCVIHSSFLELFLLSIFVCSFCFLGVCPSFIPCALSSFMPSLLPCVFYLLRVLLFSVCFLLSSLVFFLLSCLLCAPVLSFTCFGFS
jgi:hypothetical protein